MTLKFVRLVCVLSLWPALAGAQPAPAVSVPRFTHPGAGQMLYFVLTDRFANGSAANDTGGITGGPDVSGFDPTRIGFFHGGDFTGLTAKLDYIKGLGATAVWVTPPFKNKPMQAGSAGYHGYWVTDFLQIDPHLGTNAEFAEFVKQAHARGLKVYMDIIANHTADVIQYQGGQFAYLERTAHPLRDAAGHVLDERALAYNGLGDPAAFPALSATTSFPYVPVVPEAEKNIKNPAWLNEVTLYHNRGNSSFRDESSTLGDFVGLDDLFTEHPRVVQGLIAVFSSWIRDYGVDGFRIDTVRHVNVEFWQAFAPAIRALARQLGRPDFIQFGEVANETLDLSLLSEFSTTAPLDATLDFGFFVAARNFVSRGGTSAALTDVFQRDDLYTDHDSNIHSTTTFLGNHDAGRFGYFLQQDNPGAPPAQLADLVKLGHGLLLLSRGQPVVYYGDEQGLVGRGGNDMQAREDMFAAQAPDFKQAPLLGTTRTGADDKFDPTHPFYQFIARLGALRAAHPALRTGAMILRDSGQPGLFAFSRIARGEKIEYLVALNNSRREKLAATLPTSQPGGAKFQLLFDSRTPAGSNAAVMADAAGRLSVELDPLQFAVWRAAAPLPAPTAPPRIALVNPAAGAVLAFTTRETDGHVFPSRQEIRAEVGGSDGLAEVTFVLQRASRPGQYELLGTDDAPPYRIFWRPPPDLAPGEKLTFLATVNDLRGHQAVAQLADLTVAKNDIVFGIRGARVPVITQSPAASVLAPAGQPVALTVEASGTGPLEYQWLRDGVALPSATDPTYTVARAGAATAGHYQVMIHGVAGTVLSAEIVVTVPATTAGRIETRPSFASKFVAARQVDVWLPPGYDENPAERYPVIYMHDGQNIFDPATSYGGVSWEVDRALCRLIQAGQTRGAIIVGIWNTGLGRFSEYMPRKAAFGETLSLYAGGPTMPTSTIISDAYLKFLVEELKPFLDHTYRTKPDAAHTFVMGSSMGGLISAYAVAEYPQVFGGAGCVSTHLPVGDGAMIDYLAQHLPKPGTHRFYFDYGTATLDALYEPYQLKLDAVLRAAGYTARRDWVTRKFPGDEHSEKSWRARVESPLSFLLGK